MTNNPSVDSWNDFAGDYIKAEFIQDFPAKLVCVGVSTRFESNKPKLIASVEYNNRSWSFDLNKTNQNFIKALGLMPKDIVGASLTVNKIKVLNPTTKAQVDSLVIESLH
jgi:hypothetical protein